MDKKESILQLEIQSSWKEIYSEFLEKAQALNVKYKSESCGGYKMMVRDDIFRSIGLNALQLRFEENLPQEFIIIGGGKPCQV